jgi:hypothetical protein
MKIIAMTNVALLAALTVPVAAYGQGTIRGAEEGAAAGGRAGGPLGAIVGGTVGAATGTVGGILGIDDRPRFRDYVVREHRPSFHYSEEIHPGIVLPQRSVRLYDVPTEYHVRPAYAYTVINETPVIVERRTRRVVEVVE